MLIYSAFLERLDISYNHIAQKSCYTLARGLRLSQSIVNINLEGNPIGNIGVKQIMNAKNENELTDFEVNLKGSDDEIASLAESAKTVKLFNLLRPEGNYSLDLEVVYDKLILQQLLDLALDSSKLSQEQTTGAFE